MRAAPDPIGETLLFGLHETIAVNRVHDGWRITTQVMYPANGLVQVTVRGGANTIVVSDEGGAVGEARSAGIPVTETDNTLARIVRDQGLLFKEGIVYTPQVPLEAAPVAILHVANASQEVARWLYDHTKIRRTRDFKAMLAAFLRDRFDERVTHDAVIIGHSNKRHKFGNVVAFPSGRRLIIDPVVHEASSINARVVANLDVKAIHDPLIDQRIIYDDEENWSPADLNLLQVGAHVVPFSRSSDVIERIAASG